MRNLYREAMLKQRPTTSSDGVPTSHIIVLQADCAVLRDHLTTDNAGMTPQ